MTKVPDFTPEKWDKWLKDKNYAEDRVEHLEDELDKALDGESVCEGCNGSVVAGVVQQALVSLTESRRW